MSNESVIRQAEAVGKGRNTPLTDERLSEIEDRVRWATPGPWVIDDGDGYLIGACGFPRDAALDTSDDEHPDAGFYGNDDDDDYH